MKMKLILSFFLSFFIYIFLIFFFIYFIFFTTNKKEKIKQVYIHKAIINNIKKNNIQQDNTQVKKILKLPVKKVIKKEVKDTIKKSKDSFSKSGKDIKFNDIFSNVSDKIPTKKIVRIKHKNMTKKRGNSDDFTKLIKEKLSKLESDISIKSTSDKKSKDYILNEFEKVWAEINTVDGNFVTLKIDVENSKINLFVISTNLDTILLNQFLRKLKQIDISKIKNFHGTIMFNTKLKKKDTK
jgi:hypothetical protein